MDNAALLNQNISQLCPDYKTCNWATSNRMLIATIEEYLNSDMNADTAHQARFLAESICLDGNELSDISDSLERYVKRCATLYINDLPAKRNAIDRLCAKASSKKANASSKYLADLLTEQRISAKTSDSLEGLSLQCMKRVEKITRFGGIVFLPENAEIIIIGDTHGDLSSTTHILNEIKSNGILDRGGYVVFLGDYTNNGVKSWKNLSAILSFQAMYSDSVVVLSGNHEFKETYLTAFNQFLNVHWQRFTASELPTNLQDRLPTLDNHYGHLRLDLISSFGYEEGEKIYSLCDEWGLGLPYICISKNLMISHSLGKLESGDITLSDLLNSKQSDVSYMRSVGYEVWNARRSSLHSALINNREITAELLTEFNSVLDVDQFVVGHCHYRSGDTLHLGQFCVTTVVSSSPYSKDSGHYMYQQMVVQRKLNRESENLTQGDAIAGYVHYTNSQTSDGDTDRTLTFHVLET